MDRFDPVAEDLFELSVVETEKGTAFAELVARTALSFPEIQLTVTW